jgi:nickel transport protein
LRIQARSLRAFNKNSYSEIKPRRPSFPEENGAYRGFFIFHEMHFEEGHMKTGRACLMAIVFFLCLSSPLHLWAHRVEIYAWVEGNRVFTESFYSGGHKAAQSQIEVFDNNGEKLLTGKTDSQGMFSFQLPKKRGLKIVLRTPEGHRSEFNLKAGEILVPVPCMSREEIKAVIEKVLDEKLEPIQKRLAESQKRGPGITEILGGIGYIVGLMGIAIYFSHRKKGEPKG